MWTQRMSITEKLIWNLRISMSTLRIYMLRYNNRHLKISNNN